MRRYQEVPSCYFLSAKSVRLFSVKKIQCPFRGYSAHEYELFIHLVCLVDYQRKFERRNILITLISFSAIVMLVFLIDTMKWEGFIVVCLPVIMPGTGIYPGGIKAGLKNAFCKMWFTLSGVRIAGMIFKTRSGT